MTGSLRQYWVLAAGVGLLVALLAAHGVVMPGDGSDHGQVTVHDDEQLLIQPVENGSELWPYTSRSRSVEERTLAINILVYGDHERIEERFRRDSAIDWDEEPFEDGQPNETDVLPEVIRSILWRDAHGADRFVYVRSPDGDGEWRPESYQLYDGSYLGERHHIRAYESPDPDEEWVAMQAHEEYFDYFRLKHTVTSTNSAQRFVEEEFFEDDSVIVTQQFLGNLRGSDSDGWVTIIEFLAIGSAAGLLGSLAAVRSRVGRPTELSAVTRERLRSTLLAGVVIGLYVGIRLVGLSLEAQFRAVNPQYIAGALYPVLAVGLPLAVYRLARPLGPKDAFLVGATAFGGAVLLDFALVGITDLPRAILLHRVLVALALGLIAAAAGLHEQGGERLNVLLAYGLFGWIAGLLVMLLGYL